VRDGNKTDIILCCTAELRVLASVLKYVFKSRWLFYLPRCFNNTISTFCRQKVRIIRFVWISEQCLYFLHDLARVVFIAARYELSL